MNTEWPEARQVLDAIFRLPSRGPFSTTVSPEEVNAALGRESKDERTERALYDLRRTGYIDGLEADNRLAPVAVELTEKGLQAVGGWPSLGNEAVFSQLLLEIEEQLAAAATPEERTRLELLRGGLVAVGREVFTAFVNAAVDRATRGV